MNLDVAIVADSPPIADRRVCGGGPDAGRGGGSRRAVGPVADPTRVQAKALGARAEASRVGSDLGRVRIIDPNATSSAHAAATTSDPGSIGRAPD